MLQDYYISAKEVSFDDRREIILLFISEYADLLMHSICHYKKMISFVS